MMETAAILLFWASVMLVAYAYAGYPLTLAALTLVRNRQLHRDNVAPRVTFIITAFNEERRLRAKLENTLALQYAPERFEILVASDASTDGTDDIAREYSNSGVRLIRAAQRGGKEAAQKLAVEAATGEILVFSDVATVLDSDAVANIVSNFADATVGCVSSVDRVLDPAGRGIGEGRYVRYEMRLRELESRFNTVVGLSGSFFAARREVCRPWAPDLQSDFNTLCNAVALGLRGVSDPLSIGYYAPISDHRLEFQRKVRTVVRGLRVVSRRIHMLNPFRYGLFSWQLFSHKVCRWLVPFALIGAFASSAWLAAEPRPLYRLAFAAQCIFYVVAMLGSRLRRLPGASIATIVGFFVVVNLSILTAWYRFMRGEQVVRWEPSVR